MLRHASSLMVSLLLGIVAVHANWKLRQGSHIKATPPLEGINVDYFANQLQNENDFMKHLNTILIPRVPDTPGSTIVREQHELTLQLIFFDGEEAFNRWSSTDSTYGSRRLAQDWDRKIFSHEGVDARTLERIDLFVLLDLIGTSDVQFVSLKRNTQKWYNRFVRIEKQLKNGKALVQYNRPIFKDQSSFFASVEDDHVPFEKRGELI
ncbi:hypothetical protein TCAL_11218 [Tigriopus californicus]|uniref:glutaminyl-peptide cyclotransferase n=1 Tax=Tigriopus californicus TaxID=6832 RepID=A0A553PKH7_TIGCA|nr:hypothetical protein TCAL_11218 [Tigriopus californicus]